ncbi:MAG: N-acetyltransferase [Roseovarius sp.]
MAFPGFCRPMQAGEEAAVERLLHAAFDAPDEAGLVQALRREGAIAGEMVLPMGEEIVGYYALSSMRAPEGWLCLAPVAVAPEHQGKGLGRRMVGQLAQWARMAGQTVVVLGYVPFSERCGFSAARAARLTSPYPVEHTLLAGPGEDAPEAVLRYPKAFG